MKGQSAEPESSGPRVHMGKVGSGSGRGSFAKFDAKAPAIMGALMTKYGLTKDQAAVRAQAVYRAFNSPNNRTDAESDAMAATMEEPIEEANRTPPTSSVERAEFLDMLIETGTFDPQDLVALQTFRDGMPA